MFQAEYQRLLLDLRDSLKLRREAEEELGACSNLSHSKYIIHSTLLSADDLLTS
jgi:hypothetical protein